MLGSAGRLTLTLAMMLTAGLYFISYAAPYLRPTDAASARELVNRSERQEAATSNGCDPNYTGACVPKRGVDVDCAGGRGNGPLFVSGPLQVIGDDPYKLDSDGDGFACEPHR